jgi:exodeoxyribonuclease V beta subunit
MKKFDVCNIEIQGKNLIEASAGTGKTYSIALLILRLLLEKSIGIENMLIVTFTNAAVAELDIRIRKSIQQAYSIARNKSVDNDKNSDLEQIVKKTISLIGQQKTAELLKNAILFIDELSIYTIHSFCQATLTDNAFESGILFNSDIIEDQTEIIEKETQRYWRTKVTVLDKNILNVLIEKKFAPGLIEKVFSEVNSGKKLKIKNSYQLRELKEIFEKNDQELKSKETVLKKKIHSDWNNIKEIKLASNTRIYKAIQKNSEDDFYKQLLEGIKNEIKAVNIFQFLNGEEFIIAQKEFDVLKTDILSIVLNDAVLKISDEVELIKNRNKVLSFNDMIAKLYDALVVKDNPVLIRKLNSNYKAVFIDEFQDTDSYQYRIFRKAFGEFSQAILFFIGDPKQSIYGWRGADLNMYGEAKKNIESGRFFNMETNFRSTPQLLQSINTFFKPDQVSSNTFDNQEFVYYDVKAGNNELGDLIKTQASSHPFEIITGQARTGKWNKKDQMQAAAGEIAEMLNTHKILKNGKAEKLKPNDIGVLFRKNDEARNFKELLTNLKIPAVIVDDTKIIETKESADLYYLIYGILNISESNISRALLSSFTGYSPIQIKHLNIEKHIDIFFELQKTWKSSGIFSMIFDFLNKYNVRNHLIFSDDLNGERVYTNLMQLAQILNEKEVYDRLTPDRLLDWFQKARQGEKSFNKYEQQLETDEDSVQIVTVHKSKGLAYNIVVLPYFNLQVNTERKEKSPYIEYREGSSRLISFYWDDDEKAFKLNQETEENRRLLYVAITRAVYKCIINYSKGSKGILPAYLENIGEANDDFNFRNALTPESIINFQTKDITGFIPLKFASGIDQSWQVTSFSGLNYIGEISKIFADQQIEISDLYDKFIFNDLKKGAQTGLIIHEILERLNFENSGQWKKQVESVLKKYLGEPQEKQLDLYMNMLSNILNTEIHPAGFSLSSVSSHKKLSELEFYFSFDKFKSENINSLIPDLNLTYTDIRGVMHGFIDLVFEHNGMYYIVDWKTNHLGSDIHNYMPEKLEVSIRENNYHLQYTIYVIALKRYLEKKLKDFSYSDHFGGIFYLYIRGMRAGKNSGIFFTKPDELFVQSLEKMMRSKQ